ncbi:MAG: RIP metalloprotease RseP [Acidobacteria bacterium]|nr:RIP metalloprotease RseP [Acidobacteriota bacterium]
MIDFIVYGILPFIFILGAAVVLHEFGHFIVAKIQGIRVETFSVGFGPRLFGRRFGTTDYRLSLIPLGGYVKLGGDESNAAVEGAGTSNIPERERFDLRPRWQKFLVMVAGPAMNILTALAVVFFAALLSGVQETPTSPTITRVRGASEAAGLHPGDRIVEFNGEENPSLDRIQNDIRLSPEQPLPLVVERAGQRVPLTLRPTKEVQEGESLGAIDFLPDFGNVPVVAAEVRPDYPSAQAGLREGDRLVSLNEEPILGQGTLIPLVQKYKDAPLRLVYEREGRRMETTLTAKIEGDRAYIGIVPEDDLPYKPVGIVGAAGYAVRRNVEILRMTGTAFAQIFRGQRSASASIAGPIEIARQSSNVARKFGWAGVFSMLAFLSLNLGVVNLLPIPVLDGGAIFLLLVEAVLGWVGLRLSMTVRERIQQVGFVMLLLLMGFVITNDLVKTASRWRGSTESPPAAAPAK